jgi:multiple sugar transport system substrate-binding protein
MKRKIIILSLILIPLILSGCLKKKTKAIPQIPLEVWGIFDDSDVFTAINSTFEQNDPYVPQVKYRKITDRNIKEFEKELTDALASGHGPDIIYFKNSWLPKHGNKLAPMPNSDQALAGFKNTFADVAQQDFIYKNNIFAKPLYCDTLALYYNNNILNQAGLVKPPATWDELKQYTKLLTKIDKYGNIKQSTIAFGRSKNPGSVNRSGDIVALMMMQGGAVMNEGETLFAEFNKSKNNSGDPGVIALNFFTAFANSASPLYSWNTKMPYSVDAFRFGKTAMMINYSYWADRLKRSDPKLDFSIAPVPQSGIANATVNYPSYWGLAVIKNKNIPSSAGYNNNDRIREAWRYINFVTNKPSAGSKFDPGKHYLTMTHKPAVRRDLIEAQKNDPVLGVFARQALTAKSWRQVDNLAIDEIFVDMIDAVNRGAMSIAEAINYAEARIDALVRK